MVRLRFKWRSSLPTLLFLLALLMMYSMATLFFISSDNQIPEVQAKPIYPASE
ncbi:hypothetical protein SK128_015278, partial [Halocaridina rubra]